MRPNQIEDDDEEEFRGPSKSHLKRVQNELQELGRVMTGMGDETLKKIGLPEAVYDKILLRKIPTSIFGGCANSCAAPAVNASRLSPQRVLANFIVCSMPISMNRST